MKHSLKILPQHFEAWLLGKKTCELRRDDRAPRFEAGDELVLREYDDSAQAFLRFSSRYITVRVLSVLRDHEGLAPGYCLMSCEVIP